MITLKINNGTPTVYSYSNYFNLSAILPFNTIRHLTPSDYVELTLEDTGDYLITEAMQFKCNLTIIGVQGVRIKVRIPKDQTTIEDNTERYLNSHMHNDNYYLGCYGTAEQEIEVVIKDIKLIFSASHSFPFLPNYGHGAHSFIKIKHAKRLHFDNVKITTDNDRINNVLIYDSHNVILENSYLHNTHSATCNNADKDKAEEQQGSKYDRWNEGGNLWLIGNNHNVVVRNNEFSKIGNDEALGIYNQGSVPEGDYDYRRDIIVESNTFTYGDLEGDSVPCNILITIQSSETHRPIKFDNISFTNNRFVINDLVKNMLWLMIQNPLTKARDIVFSSNIFELNGFTAENASMNIFHLGCASQAQQAEIVIEHNRVISNCSINGGTTASPSSNLHFVSQQGGKAIIRQNTIAVQNVDDDHYIENPTEDTHRITLLYRNGYNAESDIIGNNANGLATFVRIASPDSTRISDRIITSKLRIIGNSLCGCTRISAQLTDQLSVEMHHNIIKSNSYYYGFLNMGRLTASPTATIIYGSLPGLIRREATFLSRVSSIPLTIHPRA